MDLEELKAQGFVPTAYPGQGGDFLTKRMPVAAMPEASRLIDDEFITENSEAITEIIFPNAGLAATLMVQLHVPDADYVERPVPLDSEAGRNLIADAINGKNR